MGIIHKPGHGTVARNLTFLGLLLLLIYAILWFINSVVPGLIGPWVYQVPSGLTGEAYEAAEMANNENIAALSQKLAIGAALFGTIAAPLMFLAINRQRFADFCIATQSEMQKVSWPTRSETARMTATVIGGTIFIAVLLFTFDLLFNELFYDLQILPTSQIRSILP